MPNFKVFNDEAIRLQGVMYDNQGQVQSLPYTAFKDLRTTQLSPIVGWAFNYNINSDMIATSLTGSGTVTQLNSKAVLQTTAVTGSSATISTKSALRYNPGLGGLVRFTAIFTVGAAGSTQIIGLGDNADGFFFGYNGTSFGILRRQNGVDNWTPQTSWNGDEMDGTGLSGRTLDQTKGNVYSIQYQWLGFGQIFFYITNPTNGQSILVHTIQYSNANTNPSVFNPTLPLWAQAINTTNATNIQLQTPSAMAFVEGNADNLAIATRNSIANSKAAVSTETSIVTIKNKSTFQSKTNRTRIKLDYISVSDAGEQPVTFYLVRNATLGGTPSYTDIGANTSVVQYDTAGTTVTGGVKVLTLQLTSSDSAQLLISNLNITLNPGDTFTLSAQCSTSTTTVAGLSWIELW